jgi:flagellar capping protein FliD
MEMYSKLGPDGSVLEDIHKPFGVAGSGWRGFFQDVLPFLAGLKDELRNPEAIKQFVQTYNDEMKRLSASSSSVLREKQRRLAKVDGEIQRALAAVMRGAFEADDVREKVATLKDERKKLQEETDRIGQASISVALHPTAITAYLKSVEQLESSIMKNSIEGREQSKATLRELVESVIVQPTQEGGGMRIQVQGYLAGLVGGDLFPQRSYQGG